MQASSPEFFYWAHDATGKAPVVATDGLTNANVGDPVRLGVGFSPAYPGEIVVIYTTGLGLTTPSVPSGALAPGAAQVTGLSVTLDNSPLDPSAIQYAGVVPGSAGLYQLNLALPSTVSPGDHPITMTINGSTSPASAYLTVGPR